VRRFNSFSFVFVFYIIQHILFEGHCVSHKLGASTKDEKGVVPALLGAHIVVGEIETNSYTMQ